MDEKTEASDMDKRDELAARIEKRREERDEKRRAQEAIDFEARLDLEDEHDLIGEVTVAKYVSGQPTRAYVKAPDASTYKRYQDRLNKAAGTKNQKALREAHEELARSCWVYPGEKDAQKAMLEKFSGLLTAVGNVAAALAEGKAEEEGKD